LVGVSSVLDDDAKFVVNAFDRADRILEDGRIEFESLHLHDVVEAALESPGRPRMGTPTRAWEPRDAEPIPHDVS
jgi:hypothetical protein